MTDAELLFHKFAQIILLTLKKSKCS